MFCQDDGIGDIQIVKLIKSDQTYVDFGTARLCNLELNSSTVLSMLIVPFLSLFSFNV